MITLSKPLFCLDLETTSLNVQEARIVEIAFQQFENIFPSTPTKEWSHLVNPGILIPQEALDTHHITDEDVKDKPSFNQIASNLVKGFSNCDFMGKNIRYDLQVLSAEMQRTSIKWSYTNARVIDADRLEQLGEPRTLSHLYKKHTGKTLLNAHSALNDVSATAEVIEKQFSAYQHLPRDLGQLHELQWPGWCDSEGKFKFDKQGVLRCTFGKWRGWDVKTIPGNYWSWIFKADFSDEIKNLVGEFTNGRYPVRGNTN